MSHKTQIAGEYVSTDGILLIRPFPPFSMYDSYEVPFLPQAMVHIRDVGQRPAKRTVQQLADALGFVTIQAKEGVVAVNPAFAHYTIAPARDDERTRLGQHTKISWNVNGRECFVHVTPPVAEVQALLPKAAAHQARAEAITAGRPHHVREIKPTEIGTDVA